MSNPNRVRTLLSAATLVAHGDWTLLKGVSQTFQAWLANAAIVDEDAVVEIHATNDPRANADGANAQYVVLGSITLAHDGDTSDAFTSAASYAYVRASLTVANGGAQVTVQMNDQIP